MTLQEKYDVTPERFKDLARTLPQACLDEATNNALILSLKEGADEAEATRFKLLTEVMVERATP